MNALPLANVAAADLKRTGCARYGYLRKLTGKLGNWKLRYVIVRAGCLYYFKGPQASSAEDQFSLLSYDIEARLEFKKMPWVFKLVPKVKDLNPVYFAAASQTDMDAWMKVIKAETARNAARISMQSTPSPLANEGRSGSSFALQLNNINSSNNNNNSHNHSNHHNNNHSPSNSARTSLAGPSIAARPAATLPQSPFNNNNNSHNNNSHNNNNNHNNHSSSSSNNNSSNNKDKDKDSDSSYIYDFDYYDAAHDYHDLEQGADGDAYIDLEEEDDGDDGDYIDLEEDDHGGAHVGVRHGGSSGGGGIGVGGGGGGSNFQSSVSNPNFAAAAAAAVAALDLNNPYDDVFDDVFDQSYPTTTSTPTPTPTPIPTPTAAPHLVRDNKPHIANPPPPRPGQAPPPLPPHHYINSQVALSMNATPTAVHIPHVPSSATKRPLVRVEDARWFYPVIKREAAEAKLLTEAAGCFLVRCSETQPGKHVLSVMGYDRVRHYKIFSDDKRYSIAGDKTFNNELELLHYYHREALPNATDNLKLGKGFVG